MFRQQRLYFPPMLIGIDTRLTYYRTGGISTYMHRLVRALAKMDSENRYIVFQSRKVSKPVTDAFATASLWTPCHHRFERLALSVELARFNLDLLHSPDFIPPLRGAKHHVITVHDLTFLHYPDYLTADSRRYYNDQIKIAVRQANHILADSESTKRDLVTMLGVESSKVSVHMLGVDERFQPLPQAVRESWRTQLALPGSYMLFVGTLEPRKNIAGLLDAYRLLVDQLPSVPPLLLVGRKGWLFDETTAKIETLDLGAHVIWRDDINDESLPAVYSLADVLVLPSFYEGFGFPALEAMACGTVPVVSNRSSLPEVVGEVGIQFDPDDVQAMAAAISRVLTDADWREKQRQMGLERAKLFTWEDTASIALSAYQAAC